MSLIAFVLIVISAGLHASWNLVAKKNHITIPFYAVICTSAMLFWLHVQFWSPIRLFDVSWQFWLYMMLSVFFDILYCSPRLSPNAAYIPNSVLSSSGKPMK